LEECVKEAVSIDIKNKKVIIFSPGASSFEKFKNEFDRGNRFTEFVLRRG